MQDTNETANTSKSRFTVTDAELTKLREFPKLPDGWTPLLITAVTVKDANSGKYGLNITHVPIPSIDSNPSVAKKRFKVYNTLWAWFKDPNNKSRKAGNTFGLWEGFVRAHGVVKQDGTPCPVLARRDTATDKLVNAEGKAVTSVEANAIRLAHDRYLTELYVEMLELAEQKADPHPLVNYAAFGKITTSEPSADGRSFQNIATLRATLPDDAVLIDFDALGKKQDDEDDVDAPF